MSDPIQDFMPTQNVRFAGLYSV